MIYLLAGAFGFIASLTAHDLAAQTLQEQALKPLAGTCPRCGHRRGWTTWRCESCGRQQSRELALAILAVCVAVLFAYALGQTWALVAYLGFLLLSLSLGITDIDSLRIVDRLNLRGTAILVLALVLAALADSNAAHLPRALLGGAAYLAGTLIVFLVARGRGFGFGDVKLSIQLGVFTAYLSWGTLGWSVLITALLGGLVSIVVLLVASLSKGQPGEVGEEGGVGENRVKTAMRAELPYGPWMILGSWCAISLAGLGAFPIPT